MNKLLIAALALGLFASCKSGGKKSGADAITFKEFRQSFADSKLPYKLTPELLTSKTGDSTAIDTALISRFLVDTLAKADFPTGKVSYYPLVSLTGKQINYLVIKAEDKNTTAAYLCVFDKKDHYLSRVQVAWLNSKSNKKEYFSIDSKEMVKITTETEVTPGHTGTTENFYSVEANGSTALIMTNSTGEAAPGQLFNPIDTLPKKNKFSGDYAAGENSIVSIRDGKDAKSFLFFISFAKESGCKGEISGTGHFAGANKGEFTDKDTECGIAFQFSASKLTIKEIGGCGAYRGIRCLFEGGFTKKK
ncbi:hypothetical protein [[Flexibacter] sp. ATCC 35208]|uniref:hypothetical protein n=1 Tax=[Flexibacter] sp. ATCC 35208 TaxID=1936242 RepID=UPI0009CC09E9|nr:hypothetical protein [[Flexibacter] sp. ATCC 35208]OMP80300.1 hypothetical protein BW716_05720 [[Flexibacter] sp. ATCC 35208]